MSGILGRVVSNADGQPALGATGPTVAELERRLAAGAAPATLAQLPGLGPIDVVALLGYLGLGPEGSEGLPLEQGQPHKPWVHEALTEPALARLLPDAPRPGRLALLAGLLQVHDFWEQSHQAAQEADDLGEGELSAYWHGIAHRREPDPGNAAYWFRRVGRSPIATELGQAAQTLLANARAQGPLPAWAEGLVKNGAWDSFAFIDACGAARRRAGAEARLARQLQRREMAELLTASFAAVAG